MSDSKEISILIESINKLVNNNDATIVEYCGPSATLVSAFLDALQHCNNTTTVSGSDTTASAVLDRVVSIKTMLRVLLYSILTRNGIIDCGVTPSSSSSYVEYYTYSEAGFEAVATIVKALLSSSWVSHFIDNDFMKQDLRDTDMYEFDDTFELDGHTVLFAAASYGHVAIVEALLADARVDQDIINCVDEKEQSILLAAVSHRHTSVVEVLLADSRVDKICIDWETTAGYTAIMYAAMYGCTSIIELLLVDDRVDKATINYTGHSTCTALVFAVQKGHTSVVELLLADARVDKSSIEYATADGNTALFHATCKGHTSIVELLLDNVHVDKAAIDHANWYGRTAMMYAAMDGCISILELFLADARVDKASIAHADSHGQTVLSLAAELGHVPIVELLLADPRMDELVINHVDIYGQTALFRATNSGHASVVETLLSDRRTWWDTIVKLLTLESDWRNSTDSNSKRTGFEMGVICTELTHRQMVAIYPSTNPSLWPVAAGPDDGPDAAGDRVSGPVSCALVTSFYNSDIFDMNVLGIIREYAAYTASEDQILSTECLWGLPMHHDDDDDDE
jgi:ankyrin repeat protein